MWCPISQSSLAWRVTLCLVVVPRKKLLLHLYRYFLYFETDLKSCIQREQAGGAKCPLDPYFIMPDKCECVDFQILKLQELPDAVPQGEMPRHMQLFADRYLCDKVVPGNRLTILGIYSIKKAGKATKVFKICLPSCLFLNLFKYLSLN